MRFKGSLWLVLMVVFSLLIVGCSSTETSQNENNQSNGTSDVDNEEESAKENNEESNKQKEQATTGGTLRVAIESQPPTLDVMTTTALVTRDVTTQMFESLLTFNSNHQPEPMLAESFETSGMVKQLHLN